jgi:hypothetical protein
VKLPNVEIKISIPAVFRAARWLWGRFHARAAAVVRAVVISITN